MSYLSLAIMQPTAVERQNVPRFSAPQISQVRIAFSSPEDPASRFPQSVQKTSAPTADMAPSAELVFGVDGENLMEWKAGMLEPGRAGLSAKVNDLAGVARQGYGIPALGHHKSWPLLHHPSPQHGGEVAKANGACHQALDYASAKPALWRLPHTQSTGLPHLPSWPQHRTIEACPRARHLKALNLLQRMTNSTGATLVVCLGSRDL